MLEAIGRGDKPAFAVFYDRWSAPVFRFATTITASQQEAEDLTAEVFLTVWALAD
ncbi:MAG: sigma factor [Marmoricola sp.]